jgi:hypothetical protein
MTILLRSVGFAVLAVLGTTGCTLPDDPRRHSAQFTLEPNVVLRAGVPVEIALFVHGSFPRHSSCFESSLDPACDPTVIQSVLAIGCAQNACLVDDVKVEGRSVVATLHATGDLDTTLEASLLLSDGTSRQARAPVRFRAPSRLVTACDVAQADQCGGRFAVLAGTELIWTLTALSADGLPIAAVGSVELQGDALAIAPPGQFDIPFSKQIQNPTLELSAARPGVGRVHLQMAGLERWQTVTVEDPEQTTALEVWSWAQEGQSTDGLPLDIDAVAQGVARDRVTFTQRSATLALALRFADGQVALGGAGLLHVTGVDANVEPGVTLSGPNTNLAIGAFTLVAEAAGEGLLQADLGSAHLRLPLFGVP